MRIIPKANTLRKGILLYRGIRYRKGFGVHSPFVFNLITKVIEERCQYYSFYDIELIRKQLLFQDDEITYPDRQQKGKMRRRTIGRIVEREAIRPKHGALLFRLANYFKSKHILQFGPSMGLSTLYLTSYASDLKCIALENVPEFASIARIAFGKAARNPVDLRVGSYKDLLPKALKDMEQLDFVFFNTLYEQQNKPQNARVLAESMQSSRSNGNNRPVFNGNRVFQQEVTQEGLYRLFLTLYPKIQTN